MSTFQVCNTVGEVVTRHPGLSRYFETAGIDYCCGGKKTLERVCQEKGLDPQALLNDLEESASVPSQKATDDPASMSLTELADHILKTHHDYLRKEFRRLDEMTAKVASAHGKSDARLHSVRHTFLAMAQEMSCHMLKEEQILFPMIRQLDVSQTPVAFHCGTLANPIRQMELEHHEAGDSLVRLRELTDCYMPPDCACNTYRAMLHALAQLEGDMHLHVHKEDNILFPRALQREAELAGKES